MTEPKLFFFQHPKFDGGEDGDDEEEDVGNGAGIAHAVGAFEGVLIDRIDERRGSAERAAFGEHVNFREDLKTFDRVQHKGEQ